MLRRPPRSPLFPYTTLFRSEPLRRAGMLALDLVEPLAQLRVELRRGRIAGDVGQVRGESLPDLVRRHLVTGELLDAVDRKSTRLNSSHANISYAVFCLKKKK